MDTENQDTDVTKFDEDDDPESHVGEEVEEVEEVSKLEVSPDDEAAR